VIENALSLPIIIKIY